MHYDTDVHVMAAPQPDVNVADYLHASFADVASFVDVYLQSDGFLDLMPLAWGKLQGGALACRGGAAEDGNCLGGVQNPHVL